MIHIKAENFRSYPILDWTVPVGLTLLDGVNLDTGGSNMAGKSTAIDALFWCRYGWLPKWGGPKGGSADSVIRRKNGEPAGKCWVKVTEQIGSDTITIERSRPSKLVVHKNGEELKGITQDGLDELLGMSAERYLVCVYLSQKRQSSFYWMSDSERAELLSLVANLEGLDRGFDHAKELKSLAQKEISRIEGALSVLEPQFSDLPEAKRKIEEALEEAEDEKVTAFEKYEELERKFSELSPWLKQKKESEVHLQTQNIQSQISSYQSQIAKIDLDIQRLGQEIEKNSKTLDPKYQSAVDDAADAIKEIRKKERDHERVVLENKRLQDLVLAETGLAEAAMQGRCNHCGQDLTAEKRQSQAMSHLKRAQEFQSQIRNPPSVPNLVPIQKEYEQAMSILAQKQAEIDAGPGAIRQQILTLIQSKKAIEAQVRELEKETLLIEAKIQSEIADQLRTKRKEVDEAKSVLNNFIHECSRVQSQLDETEERFQKIKDRLDLSREELRVQNFNLDKALDMIELFGPKGYRVIAFDGLVKRISDRAGELLSIMTDSLYSTRMDSVGQDSKGNQKLILKPAIIRGGIEVPKDDLSGGAETRVALAYDIAVAEAAGEGHPLFLDEVLEGMDSIGKSEAMTLLEEVSKTRPVIVVDHTSEFKAAFTQVIRVVYQNEESRLEV